MYTACENNLKTYTRVYKPMVFLFSICYFLFEYMLYFVPAPIGNKEDITLRALRILKETEIFFCEDTGTTKKLMNMYEISLTGKQFMPLTSFTDQ